MISQMIRPVCIGYDCHCPTVDIVSQLLVGLQNPIIPIRPGRFNYKEAHRI